MTRVPLIEPPRDVGRNDWNITKVLAHSTCGFEAFTRFAGGMQRNPEVSGRSRELAILRVGAICGSEYEWRRHVVFGREAGLTDTEIDAVKQGNVAPFNARESSAIRWAEAVETRTVTQGLFDAVREQFTDAQLVELTLVSSMYSMVSRFLLALDVDIDDDVTDVPSLGGPVGTSTHA
jgi:4-carboxymuconolactone decarboxylase